MVIYHVIGKFYLMYKLNQMEHYNEYAQFHKMTKPIEIRFAKPKKVKKSRIEKKQKTHKHKKVHKF